MTEEKDETKTEKPEKPEMPEEATKKETEAGKREPEATKFEPEAAKLKQEAAKLEPEAAKLKQEAAKREPEAAKRASKAAMPALEQSTSRLKMRRQSIGYSAIPNIRGNEAASAMGLEYKRPLLTYEPTYQLDPITRFKCSEVEKLISRHLDSYYDSHVYHVDTSSALAISLANSIMKETKYMLFNRYRILCVVAIGQQRAQSYNNAVSFLWDKFRDGYVDMQRKNYSSFIQITVFGIYLD